MLSHYFSFYARRRRMNERKRERLRKFPLHFLPLEERNEKEEEISIERASGNVSQARQQGKNQVEARFNSLIIKRKVLNRFFINSLTFKIPLAIMHYYTQKVHKLHLLYLNRPQNLHLPFSCSPVRQPNLTHIRQIDSRQQMCTQTPISLSLRHAHTHEQDSQLSFSAWQFTQLFARSPVSPSHNNEKEERES